MTLLALIGASSYSITSAKTTESNPSIEELEIAAEANDAKALISLGIAYFQGRLVAQDYKKAKDLFQRASDQGFSEPTTMLAIMYLKGLGVVADEEKATELFKKAETMRNMT